MLMSDRKTKRGTSEMTEFGKTLNTLMVMHGIFEWKDLLGALESVGYEIGQPRLSGYLYGDRNPRNPQELFDAIARALELSEEEKMRLIYSYGYPKQRNNGGPTQRNIDQARLAEEKIKERAQQRKGAGENTAGDDRA